jgi:rRNA maturation endonuclease Nob1
MKFKILNKIIDTKEVSLRFKKLAIEKKATGKKMMLLKCTSCRRRVRMTRARYDTHYRWMCNECGGDLEVI